MRLMVLAPSGRRLSETFVRANIAGLPFETVAYFGDLYDWRHGRLQVGYAVATLLAKLLERIGWSRAATHCLSSMAFLLVRHHRPSCVIAEFGFHAVLVMELAAWSDVPLIVHFRGADLSAERYLCGLQTRYRRLLTLAAAAVVKSQPMQQRVAQLSSERHTPLPVLVSPSGADPERFRGAQPQQAPPHFLAVGRFVAKKGPQLTLAAFGEAARQRPHLRLTMVGEGPLLSWCRRWVIENGLADCVELCGPRSSAWIAEQMRHARGFLQHSLTAPDGDQEGCPVAVIEAQLSGLPVVGTFHAGIPDVVRDGETGYLVAEGDISAMASAIARLADDPMLAARLGQVGAERSRQQFTVGHHLDALTALIEAVVAGNPSDSLPA